MKFVGMPPPVLMVEAFCGNEDALATWFANGAEMTIRSFGFEMSDWHRIPPARYVEFLGQMRLVVEDDKRVFVHAGLRPGVPLACQDPMTSYGSEASSTRRASISASSSCTATRRPRTSSPAALPPEHR